MAQLHPIPYVCGRTGLGRTSIYGYIAAGKLKSIKVGRRRLVAETAIEELIAYLESQSDTSVAS
ncbi:helix-turn-helix domain-containing protein [Rhodococcus sp. ARC_M13]|uniref:helix-turn-helix transcriptional regulator n=1 Tax=Rhodococcus sp. ARC_M13 TaxID=2928855 RepID=UPI001FB512C7|nr:helix-turn-helix domain-containing protein [Rhodococcus sp. ARC_M13]MCJ0899763.1 helix-turn-helix domain-containing protein [Rhodococcus sp. ARC_M13]